MLTSSFPAIKMFILGIIVLKKRFYKNGLTNIYKDIILTGFNKYYPRIIFKNYIFLYIHLLKFQNFHTSHI